MSNESYPSGTQSPDYSALFTFPRHPDIILDESDYRGIVDDPVLSHQVITTEPGESYIKEETEDITIATNDAMGGIIFEEICAQKAVLIFEAIQEYKSGTISQLDLNKVIRSTPTIYRMPLGIKDVMTILANNVYTNVDQTDKLTEVAVAVEELDAHILGLQQQMSVISENMQQRQATIERLSSVTAEISPQTLNRILTTCNNEALDEYDVLARAHAAANEDYKRFLTDNNISVDATQSQIQGRSWELSNDVMTKRNNVIALTNTIKQLAQKIKKLQQQLDMQDSSPQQSKEAAVQLLMQIASTKDIRLQQEYEKYMQDFQNAQAIKRAYEKQQADLLARQANAKAKKTAYDTVIEKIEQSVQRFM